VLLKDGEMLTTLKGPRGTEPHIKPLTREARGIQRTRARQTVTRRQTVTGTQRCPAVLIRYSHPRRLTDAPYPMPHCGATAMGQGPVFTCLIYRVLIVVTRSDTTQHDGIAAVFIAGFFIDSSHPTRGRPMSTPRIAFVLTSHDTLGDTGNDTGYFLSEVAHPYLVLHEAGAEIDFISPEGGPVPMDPSSRDLEDKGNATFLRLEGMEDALNSTTAAADVDPADYDAIYFAGGHGTMWDFPDNEALQHLTAAIYEDGGAVGAVCHGPAGLVNVHLSDGSRLIDGKRVSCFTDAEEHEVELQDVVPFLLETTLRKHGATIEKAGNWEASVAVDGRLVTGQNPASAEGVGEALARILRERPVTA